MTANSEKDRFGDKLRDLEHAREDLYFAERDRQLIAKMRAEGEAWHAEVQDLMALVRAVAAGEAPLATLKANQAFLDEEAASKKAGLSLPGVKAIRQTKAAAP